MMERIFGEPYHVKDRYSGHRITIRFIMALVAVYACQGCINWMFIAIRFYGAAVWNIGPSKMQNFSTIMFLPWNIKIIYGLMVDALPIFGYKRKSYMILFGSLAPISMLIIILYPSTYNVQLIMMTINQLSVSICDVIADALTVERTQFKSHTVAARLQAVAWGSRTIAVIVGSLTTGPLQKSGEPDDILKVYWIYFCVLLLLPICSILLPENRGRRTTRNDYKNPSNDEHDDEQEQKEEVYSVGKIFYLLFETLCRKSIFYPLLFIFILYSTPSAGEAFQFYLIYELGFTSIQINYLTVISSVTFLIAIGIITFQSRLSKQDEFSLKKLFLIWTLISTILPFMTLILIFGLNSKIGFPDFLFVVSDLVITGIPGGILSMGVNVLFARICPPGIEGFFMTALTSIANIASTVSLQIGSGLISGLNVECVEDIENTNSLNCNFTNLWILVIITNLTTLIPLIFINKIPNEKELKIIGEKLKVSVINNTPNQEDMIKLFSLCINYIFPFFKCNVYCCSYSNDDGDVDDNKCDINKPLTPMIDNMTNKTEMIEINKNS